MSAGAGEALGQGTVIIGNGGAGKSTLARQLATRFDLPAIDLDLLHWEDEGVRPQAR